MKYIQALKMLDHIAIKEGARFYSTKSTLESDEVNGTYNTFNDDNVHFKCVWASADKQYTVKIQTWLYDSITLEINDKNHGWVCVKFQTKSLPDNSSEDTPVYMTVFDVVEGEGGLTRYLIMLVYNIWQEIINAYERW